jgi:hypothetical protein
VVILCGCLVFWDMWHVIKGKLILGSLTAMGCRFRSEVKKVTDERRRL